jgi:hypothetical protein
MAVKNMLVNALGSHFAVEDWCESRQEVQQEVIDRPWVVVGLPRTGTSILSILMGLDPFNRHLMQWEAQNPIPPSSLASVNEDPRVAACTERIGQLNKMNPTLASMHPFGSKLAEECTAVFLYAMRTIGMETIAYTPSYGQWLDTADMAPAYAIHKQLLQALQHAQPSGSWILKSPNHLWCLPELLRAYPDARVIWTHRDPARLVPSLASLNSAMQIQLTRDFDPGRVGEYWASKVDTAVNSAAAFDDSAGDDWCCHVQYQDLMARPEATLEKIYEHFGEAVNPVHRRRMASWLDQRPQHSEGIHSYQPGDFGWTSEELQQRYRQYRDRYKVPTED